MTPFGQNLKKLMEKNELRQQDINDMFGWSINAARDYIQNGRHPKAEKWTILVQRTGISEHEWKHTIIPDDEIPILKFTTERRQREYAIMMEDAEEYGTQMVKIDISPLLKKITDLEMRIERLEKFTLIDKH